MLVIGRRTFLGFISTRPILGRPVFMRPRALLDIDGRRRPPFGRAVDVSEWGSRSSSRGMESGAGSRFPSHLLT